MSNILPADWKDLLSRVRDWLDEAGRTADQRERDFAERCPEAPADARPEIDTTRLRDLATRMRSLESAAAEADAAAVTEEVHLRQRVERSESLRLRLAERLQGRPSLRDGSRRAATIVAADEFPSSQSAKAM